MKTEVHFLRISLNEKCFKVVEKKYSFYVHYLFMRKCGKIFYSQRGHILQYNTAHALCMLGN